MYSIFSDLMTSSMKSEPGTPAWAPWDFGVRSSAAAATAVGLSADGRRTASERADGIAAASAVGIAVAALEIATPAMNLRRSTGFPVMRFPHS